MLSVESAGTNPALGGGGDQGAPVCTITARHWEAVALWTWNVKVEMCAICKSSIADFCIECRSMGGGNAGTAEDAKDGNSNDRGVLQKRGRIGDEIQKKVNDGNAKWKGEASGECLVVWGVCNHVFHHHCISRWVQQRAVCPVCGGDWKVLKTTKNDE